MTTEADRESKRKWARKSYAADPEKHKERSRQWAVKNKDKRRDWHLKKTYGVTLEWYNQTLESQGGCAICKAKEPGGRDGRFHVDHNHQTGEVRGLLCNHCNLMVGLAKDDPEVLRRATTYLESHEP